MEIGDLVQGIQLISGALDVVKPLLKRAKQQGMSDAFIRDLNEAITNMGEGVIVAQSITLQLQEDRAHLISRIAELEKEAAYAASWGKEKERYVLERLPHSVGWSKVSWGFKLRKSMRHEDEPLHYLCTVCFEDRIKSYLTFQSAGMPAYCPRCVMKRRETVTA